MVDGGGVAVAPAFTERVGCGDVYRFDGGYGGSLCFGALLGWLGPDEPALRRRPGFVGSVLSEHPRSVLSHRERVGIVWS